MRNHAFSTLALPDIGVTLIALSTVPFLVFTILRSHESTSALQQKSSPITLRVGTLFIWMLALTLGATAIYVLAGGYSLDSRKRYLIVPLVIMLTPSVAWFLISRARHRKLLQPSDSSFFGSIATTMICTIGCITSRLMLSVWKYEVLRINLLADVIAENELHGNLQLEWNSDIIDVWPASASSWGLDSTLALNRSLNARGHEAISVSSNAAHRMFWNNEERRWILDDQQDGREFPASDSDEVIDDICQW